MVWQEEQVQNVGALGLWIVNEEARGGTRREAADAVVHVVRCSAVQREGGKRVPRGEVENRRFMGAQLVREARVVDHRSGTG